MAEPVEDLLEFNLDNSAFEQAIRVGNTLVTDHQEWLLDLWTEYRDVFTWTHDDMPRIDPEIMVHMLNVRPIAKHVR